MNVQDVCNFWRINDGVQEAQLHRKKKDKRARTNSFDQILNKFVLCAPIRTTLFQSDFFCYLCST